MKYGVTTDLSAEKVVGKAIEFFKKNGLEVKAEGPGNVHLESSSGYVDLQVCGEGPVEVDIETKEYDAQVKRFIQRIGF